ncbi:MAG: glycosyltransferase family 4 protein [Marinilabiliaceae bacterium]
MKILMIIESLRDGGKQRRMVEMLRVMAERSHHRFLVLFLKNEVHYNEVYQMEGVEFCYLKRGFRADPRIFWSFIRRAHRFGPDVVHAWGGLPALIALPYVIGLGKPFVNGMIANSRLKIFSVEWFRVLVSFPFSDLIVANSEIGLKVYKVPPKKRRLIRNGINFDRVVLSKPIEEIRATYGLNGQAKVVGMVATIDWRKNFPMFIRSALELLKVRDDVIFMVVGDGPDRENIRRMVPPGKENRFVFTGKISNVEDTIAIFDVGVLASYGEGTSNSLLEYMLLEKPVVVTEVPGITEVVSQGEHGYLVQQDDDKAMMQKIGELLDDPEKARKMGQAGKDLVAREYSIDRMASRYEAVYEEVTRS